MEMTAISQSLALAYSPHPLQPAHGRELLCIDWRIGETVQALLERSGIDPGALISVTWNGRLLCVDEWDVIIPRPNDMLQVRAEFAGGGKKGSNPLQLVLTVALMVVGNVFGAALGAAMFGTTGAMATLYGGVALSTILGQAVISIAGNLLMGALFKPSGQKAKGSTAEDVSPTYSLSGGSNRMRPFEPMPVVLGTHRIFPDLCAAAYTDFQGDDQYLYQIFHFGLSDCTLADLRMGETPLSDFSDLSLHWPDAEGRLTGFPGNVDSTAGAAITAAAGWVSRTSGRDAYALAIDLEGQFYKADGSSLTDNAADFEIEYRLVGSTEWRPFVEQEVISWGEKYWSLGSWEGTKWVQSDFGGTNPNEHIEGAAETVLNQPFAHLRIAGRVWHYRPYAEILNTPRSGFASNRIQRSALLEPAPPQPKIVSRVPKLTLSGKSTKPLRRTLTLEVSPGQYEVRMRRTSPDETSTNSASMLNWGALKTFQPDASSYQLQNRLGIDIKASGQLNGVIQQLSATATQHVSYYKDGQWRRGPNNNPAWIFVDFCLGRRSPDGRELYGCFIGEDEIDWDAIMYWALFCETYGLTCNLVLDQAQTAGEVLDTITRCGLGSVSRTNGKVGVVWDAPNLPVTAVFGMSNIIKGTYSIAYGSETLADEIVVTFVNPDKGWAQDQVRVVCPGVTSPVRSTTVSLTGCTSETMAALYANYLAAQQFYRARRVTWEADLEGSVCSRGDVILNSHDLAQWGYSGRLVSVDGKAISLDRHVRGGVGSHSVWLVRPDGQIIDAVVNLTEAGAFDRLELLDLPDLQADALVMDHKWFFGPLGTPGKKLKVLDVEPLGDSGRVRIIATDEFTEFYAAWHGKWDAAPQVTLLGDAVAEVTGVTFTEAQMLGGDIEVSLTLSTSGGYASARAIYAVDDVVLDETQIMGRSASIQVRPLGTLSVVLTPLNALGHPGRSVTYRHAIGSVLPGSGVSNGGLDTTPGVSVRVDQFGSLIISYTTWSDPQIIEYELRVGPSFEEGEKVAASSGTPFSLPLLAAAGSVYWIKGRYASGGYTVLSHRIDLSGGNLSTPQGISWRINEPAIVFSWSAVAGAAQYVALFEDSGVTTIRTVVTPEASFVIPKGEARFRVFAVATNGSLSSFADEEVSVSGLYRYNELLSVNLPITSGTYVNLAFTNDNTVKRASLRGLTPAAPYAQNINDGDLYTLGYNLASVPASEFATTPAAWFRRDFWKAEEGFFESGLVDLGAVYTGKLLLSLSKTINYVGAAPVSSYSHVLSGYMADATAQSLIDQQAFLSARFMITAGNPGDGGWTEATNGDWVTARYLKIVVEVAMASPLTEITITSGTISIDVPDITETGSATGVTSSGKAILFDRSYHNVSVVLATARGAARAHVTAVTPIGCTLWVDSGTQQVDYFIKGY